MKLSSYFNSQHGLRLSDEKKLSIFHRIQKNKNLNASKSLTKRIFFQKKVRYSFMGFALVSLFFGTYFWDSFETRNYRAFLTHKVPSINSTVASQVAKILEINGDYVIEKDGKQFFNSVLFDGDLITLKEKSKILFNITQDSKIEITGPAQFMITKKLQGGYLLKLIDGDFLRIEADNPEDVITIETQKFSLETQKEKKINLELSKTNNNFQVKNQGSSLLVIKKTEDEVTKNTLLAADKVLTVQDDDLTKIEDIGSFRTALLTKNITYTNTVRENEQQEKQDNFEKILQEFSGMVSENEQISVSDGVLPTYQDKKKVPTENQLSQITAALNTQFLQSEIQNLYEAIFENNDVKSATAYLQLGDKIFTIGKSFNVEVARGTNATEIISAIDALIKGLEGYHIPPTKINQLGKIKNWLKVLSKQPLQERSLFSAKLPASLQFN